MFIVNFSTTLVWNIFHSKKNSARYYHKYTYTGLHVPYRLYVSDFNQSSNFLKRSFFKCSNINFRENLYSRSRDVPCGMHTNNFNLNITFIFTLQLPLSKNMSDIRKATSWMATGMTTAITFSHTIMTADRSNRWHNVVNYDINNTTQLTSDSPSSVNGATSTDGPMYLNAGLRPLFSIFCTLQIKPSDARTLAMS